MPNARWSLSPRRLAAALVGGAAVVGVVALASRGARPAAASPLDRAAHRASWEAWKAGRDRSLRTPGRPLSYTGLTWLRPGANRVGADTGSDVRLPGRDVPRVVGTLVRDGARVRFVPAAGVAVTVDSQPARSGWLRTDADSGRPSRVAVGSAAFRIVRRVDSIGVRAWDAERRELREFAGVTHFPLDPAWRLAARFVPLPAPRRVAVMTEAGVPEEHDVVGAVHAEIGGKAYALTAFAGARPAELFLVFADATSGEESYGFRFLRAARDTATNAVTLDFNFAYNPDCAFSPYTTCPLPPPENRIAAPIRAGERAYGHADDADGSNGADGSDDVAAADVGAPLALGAPVPAYDATTLAGDRVRLGGGAGGLTLVNVWATWCTSCREEMADLEALHREFAPRGLRVVAVSIDAGTTARVRRFVDRQRLTLPVVHDAAGAIQRRYGVVGVPESYLVAPGGRLRWHHVGGIHGATRDARAAIVAALAPAASPDRRATTER